MQYFGMTLRKYIEDLYSSTLNDKTHNENNLRIFITSIPPQIVHDVGSQLRDYLEYDVEFIFKVGNALYQKWIAESDKNENLIEKIRLEGWVDEKDQLTHYRNKQLDIEKEYKTLVIVLVGVELATDKSGLQDFYRIDPVSIWNTQMQKSFKSWIEEAFDKHNIYTEKEDFEELNELLVSLYHHSLNDLIRMSSFIEQLNLDHIDDCKEVILEIYSALNFWDLPIMSQIPKRKNKNTYINEAKTFFSYTKYLKPNERQKALSKIELSKEKISRGELIAKYSEEFDSSDDLLSCLVEYIEKNTEESRERLLKTDFIFIKDKILGIKPPPQPPGENPPQKSKKVEGEPIEAILTGIWLSLIDFKRECDQKDYLAAELLTKIKIEAVRFVHDYDEKQIALIFLQEALGGIDEYIKSKAHIQLIKNDELSTDLIIESQLCNKDSLDNLPLLSARSNTPNFQFKVIFEVHEDFSEEVVIEREFQWLLPDIHPYRNLKNFYKLLYSKLNGNNFLPVCHTPHYEELFLVSDPEEANRIFKLGLNNIEIRNLLDAPDIDSTTSGYSYLKDLTFSFGKYLKSNTENGFFHALTHEWPNLSKSYSNAIKNMLDTHQSNVLNILVPILYKSFFILQKPEHNQSFDFWQHHIESAIITGIHPALIEMMLHRDVFLLQSFSAKAEEYLRDTDKKKPSLKTWENVCELASIHYPLFGLISDDNKTLNTQIQSMGLLHKFGIPQKRGGILSSKVLLKYDAPEDQVISNTELFRSSRESTLITRILNEYTKVHPHALDGISIAIINVNNIQSIIAGIDKFLENIMREQEDDASDAPPYYLTLILLTKTGEDHVISHWMEEWRQRWNAVGSENKFRYYNKCRLSISQRFVSAGQEIKDYINIVSRENFEVDVLLLPNFIESGSSGNEFLTMGAYKVDYNNPLKYPIVEMPCGKSDDPSKQNQRSRIISNRQFQLATLHSEMSAALQSQSGKSHVVRTTGDFKKWIPLIDKIHTKANWIGCIDPFIDEHLIAQYNHSGAAKREIIGFASGLGAHGELNYTISTERTSLHNIEKGIANQVNRLVGPWNSFDLKKASHFIVEHSRKLAGLSLVRATSPKDEYVRNLIAFALVRAALPEQKEIKNFLCDELISLDTFSHWFDDANTGLLPDLLRIVAFINDQGFVEISAHIIECKFAKYSESHLDKAHAQLEHGLMHLTRTFLPCRTSGQNRHDQRYWWAQLQRLIAGKSNIAHNSYHSVMNALEKLLGGHFVIRWHASAVVFWTDQSGDSFKVHEKWPFNFGEHCMEINAVSCGTNLIHKICCTTDMYVPIPLSASYIEYGIESENIQEQKNENKRIWPDSAPQNNENETVYFNGQNQQNQDQEQKTDHFEIQSHSQQELSKTVFDNIDESIARNINEAIVNPDFGAENSHIADENGNKSDNIHIIGDEESDHLLKIPGRIFLGNAISNGSVSNKRVYWEFGHKQLTNRHFLIFGQSGTGKTYAIQSILYELSSQEQNSIIVDYTNGFETSQLEGEIKETVNPKQHLVSQIPLPINPFRKQSTIIDGQSFPEKATNTAMRIVSVFDSVYNLGEQQRASLYNAIMEGIEIYDTSLNLELLTDILQRNASEKGPGKEPSASLLNKIIPFVHQEPFRDETPESWNSFYTDKNHRVHIIQLAGCSKIISRLITEFILVDFYWYARSIGNKNEPKVIVLDEIQNLDHKLESPLGSFLTEGRKFGISSILATQTLSNLHADQKDRLFQSAHKLFFKPAETEVQEYSKILEKVTGESSSVWIQRLSQLQKGQCYSIGPSLNEKTGIVNKPYRIQITPLPDRIKGNYYD